jgi:hypothetical protein
VLLTCLDELERYGRAVLSGHVHLVTLLLDPGTPIRTTCCLRWIILHSVLYTVWQPGRMSPADREHLLSVGGPNTHAAMVTSCISAALGGFALWTIALYPEWLKCLAMAVSRDRSPQKFLEGAHQSSPMDPYLSRTASRLLEGSDESSEASSY